MKLNNAFEEGEIDDVPRDPYGIKTLMVVIDPRFNDEGVLFDYEEDNINGSPVRRDLPEAFRKNLGQLFQGERVEKLVESGMHISFTLYWAENEYGIPAWLDPHGLPFMLESDEPFRAFPCPYTLGPKGLACEKFDKIAHRWGMRALEYGSPTAVVVPEVALALAHLGGRLLGPLNAKVQRLCNTA